MSPTTPRERLRLELNERYGEMADNLEQALAEGNGEKAVRLYCDTSSTRRTADRPTVRSEGGAAA